jgi:hypothetical protein
MTALFNCAKQDVEMFGDIHGIVTNSTSGEPLRNVSVTLLPGGKSTVTGSDGSFEYQKLTPGQYAVQVQSDGYVSNSKTVTVEPEVVVRCDISITPGVGSLYVSVSSLEFGPSDGSRSFVIANNGAGNLNWRISYQCAWITSLSSSSGLIPAGGTSTVTVYVDPSKAKEEKESTILYITSDSGNAAIAVTVTKGGNDNPGGGTPASTVTNGLYVYFPFNGNTRNTTETDLNAVAVNEPTFEEGSIDGSTSIKFSRTQNSYLSIPEGLIDGTIFSISFWIKGVADGHIFHVMDESYLRGTLFVGNGKLAFKLSLPFYYMEGLTTYSHGNITDNQWHMITLTSKYTFSNITTKLYLDGEYTDVVTESSGSPGKCIKFVMGGGLHVSTYLSQYTIPGISMNIDNLRVYDTRELSANEIRQIYRAEGGR